MRRIPRPQRAIDPSLPIPSLLRNQVPAPSCLRAASPYPHLRTTSASFSTTPTFSFLLSGKQDKKKHQAFVRRWQKRLLGDSEPIGAHVDPYDPTSPVRIAPEEQGEEVEVLEEAQAGLLGRDGTLYEEARNGRTLRHVGGKQWVEHLEEGNLAKEFEKLTLRTYTPLSLNMANEVEDLTGTQYTLRDENFMMAQTFEEVTGKPYTDWSFGRRTRVRSVDALRKSFHQAVVEVYALKLAGKNIDPSALPNRGIYEAPEWLHSVKLQKTSNGEFELAFSGENTLESLLEEMQTVPEWSPEQGLPGEEELLLEDEPVIEQPVMDPNTPPAKRAALVSQDPDKKPFDFMSNRPVPRTPPTAPSPEAVESIQETVVVEPVVELASAPSPPLDIEAVAKTSSSAVSELRHAVLEFAAKSSEQNVDALRKAVHGSTVSLANKTVTTPEVEAKWRNIPLTDINIKFALTKRLNQLTGLYISDLHLTSASTLGDIYHYFSAATKPELAKVHNYIQVEGGRLNQKANQAIDEQTKFDTRVKPRSHVGDLLKLGNVEVHRKRPNATQERRKIGLQKAINQELKKRKLLQYSSLAERREALSEKNVGRRQALPLEGTRAAPEFGTVVSINAAEALKKRTERKRKELEEQAF